jgi:hypothetical protein
VEEAVFAACFIRRAALRHALRSSTLPGVFAVPPTRSIKAKISSAHNGGWRKTLEFSDRRNTCKLRVFKVMLGNPVAFSASFSTGRGDHETPSLDRDG